MSSRTLHRARAALNIPPYVRCSVLVSMAGYIFGFDTSSIGPITLMADFKDTFGPFSFTIQGVADRLDNPHPCRYRIPRLRVYRDRISRTRAVSLGCGVYGIGALLPSLAAIHISQSSGLAMVFVGRVLSGLGLGIFLSASAVYGIEVAPAEFRGRVGCILQLMICIGQMVGYFVCYGSLNLHGSLSWRLPWIIQTITCIIVCISVPMLPHSPRWLVHVGRHEEAKAAVRRLGLDEDEFFSVEEQEKAAQENVDRMKEGGWRASVCQFNGAFAPGLRGRSAMAIFMLGMQQLSGIDAILYYAPVVFKQAGISSDKASFLASGVTTIINVVFTVIGQMVSDHWGRRTALIAGGSVMGTAMIMLGYLNSVPNLSMARNRAIIAMVFIFFIAFIVTWGNLMRIWVSEAQPVQTRASISSLSLVSNWSINWIIAFTTPIFLEASPGGPYFLFGACLWISVLVFWLYLPETRGTDIGALGMNLSLRIEPRWLRKTIRSYRAGHSSRTAQTLVDEEMDEKAGAGDDDETMSSGPMNADKRDGEVIPVIEQRHAAQL